VIGDLVQERTQVPIQRIDATNNVLDIFSDLSIKQRDRKPGPPERVDGMTVGLVTMKAGEPSPHNGEMHPDGDEILLVTSGMIRISCDSCPTPLDLGEGQACIVSMGEWHIIECLDDSQFVHVKPGPRGEARFE